MDKKFDVKSVECAKLICSKGNTFVYKLDVDLFSYVKDLFSKCKSGTFEKFVNYINFSKLIVNCGKIVSFKVDPEDSNKVDRYYSFDTESLRGYEIYSGYLFTNKDANTYWGNQLERNNYYLSYAQLKRIIINRAKTYYKYVRYEPHAGEHNGTLNNLSQLKKLPLKLKQDIALVDKAVKFLAADMPQYYKTIGTEYEKEKLIKLSDIHYYINYDVDNCDGKYVNLNIYVESNYYNQSIKIQKFYKFYKPVAFVTLTQKDNADKFVKF